MTSQSNVHSRPVYLPSTLRCCVRMLTSTSPMGVAVSSAEVSDQMPLAGFLLSLAALLPVCPLVKSVCWRLTGRRRRFAELGAGDAADERVGDAGESAGTALGITGSTAVATGSVCGALCGELRSTFIKMTCWTSVAGAFIAAGTGDTPAFGFGRRRLVMRSFSSVVTAAADGSAVAFPLFLSVKSLVAACADGADDGAVGDSEASACVAYVDLTCRRERRVLCCSGVVGAAEDDANASPPPLWTRMPAAAAAEVSLEGDAAVGAGDGARGVSSRREERRGAAVVASPAASSAMFCSARGAFVNWRHFSAAQTKTQNLHCQI